MEDSPRPVQEAVKDFDQAADREATEVAEQERRTAVEQFPLDAWPTMPLERYALGQGNKRDSYCWWMEFGTPHVGSMKGGSARKHIIYKMQDGNWFYDQQSYKSVEQAWQAVRSGFVQASAPLIRSVPSIFPPWTAACTPLLAMPVHSCQRLHVNVATSILTALS
jgi:hypothetical protein